MLLEIGWGWGGALRVSDRDQRVWEHFTPGLSPLHHHAVLLLTHHHQRRYARPSETVLPSANSIVKVAC